MNCYNGSLPSVAIGVDGIENLEAWRGAQLSKSQIEMSDAELKEILVKFKESRKLQKSIVDALSAKTKIHNVKFLVDTYGIYLGAKKFWSEFSDRREHGAIQFIATRALEMLRTGYEMYSPLWYNKLIREYEVGKVCFDLNNDLDDISKELDKYDGVLKCKFSYTYAAAPDDNGKVEKRVVARSLEGELDGWYEKSLVQSLRHYPEFVSYLKNSYFTKGNLQKGYLQVIFEQRKVDLSEKEVDAILIIEAMDLLHCGEVQEVVLVSNDSDFNPLGNRFWGTDTKFSQVSLGNIISGGGISRLSYPPDPEIFEHVKRDKILVDLIRENTLSLNQDEIEKIQDFLNREVIE